MNSYFEIPNTINYDPQQMKIEYKSPDNYPNWLDKYNELKNKILLWSKNNKSKVIIRCFDGEWKYLNKTKMRYLEGYYNTFDEKIINKMKENLNNVDILTSHLTHVEDRIKVLPNRKLDYPMEFIYSLLSTKWILNNFKNEITLIGGSDRMELIKQLMKSKEYRTYINQDRFNEYISVPNKQCCEQMDTISKSIEEGLRNSKSKIVLFGMGISKLGIIDKLKGYHNAIYIDIGHGMDCLAGIGNPIRPYFGMWKNYRLKKFNYNNIYFCDNVHNYPEHLQKIYNKSIIDI